MAENNDADLVEIYSGDKWNYQVLVAAMLSVASFTYHQHIMNIILLAPPVAYTCLDDGLNTTNTCPCQYPEYDRGTFEETVIMTWDLICDRQWLVSISQSCLHFGMLVGSFVFGVLSDRFGRKKTFLLGHAIQFVAGMALAFVSEFWMFAFLRFLIGSSLGCYLVVGYVQLLEATTKPKRDIMSLIFRIPANIGALILPVYGYYIRHWRYLEIGMTLPIVLMFFFFWVMPESPRWSLATGRTEQAIATIKTMAKINRFPSDGVEKAVTLHAEQERGNKPNSATILDVLRNPSMRRTILLLAIVWLCGSFFYVGVSTYVGQLSGDIFVNAALLSLSGWPGLLGGHFITKYTKRRQGLIITLSLTSASMFVITIMKIFSDDNIIQVIIACFAVTCNGTYFIIIYLITAESFPTVVRNATFGISSTSARVGSMIGAFVAYMEVYGAWVPSAVFGIAAVIALTVSFFLQETKGCALLTTMGEDKDMKKGEE